MCVQSALISHHSSSGTFLAEMPACCTSNFDVPTVDRHHSTSNKPSSSLQIRRRTLSPSSPGSMSDSCLTTGGGRNIPCPRPGCGKFYSSNSSLRNHIRRKHKSILDQITTSSSTAPSPPAGYPRSSPLRLHDSPSWHHHQRPIQNNSSSVFSNDQLVSNFKTNASYSSSHNGSPSNSPPFGCRDGNYYNNNAEVDSKSFFSNAFEASRYHTSHTPQPTRHQHFYSLPQQYPLPGTLPPEQQQGVVIITTPDAPSEPGGKHFSSQNSSISSSAVANSHLLMERASNDGIAVIAATLNRNNSTCNNEPQQHPTYAYQHQSSMDSFYSHMGAADDRNCHHHHKHSNNQHHLNTTTAPLQQHHEQEQQQPYDDRDVAHCRNSTIMSQHQPTLVRARSFDFRPIGESMGEYNRIRFNHAIRGTRVVNMIGSDSEMSLSPPRSTTHLQCTQPHEVRVNDARQARGSHSNSSFSINNILS